MTSQQADHPAVVPGTFHLDREARLAGLTAWHARPGEAAGSSEPLLPLLFVHGMWEGAWFWEPWLRFFASRGWDCWAIDLRGHGASRPAEGLGKISVYEYLEDALGAARELGEPVVVGHSMGGLLAMKLAEELDPPAAVAVTPAAPRGFRSVRTWPLAKAVLAHLPEILLWKPLAPSFEEMKALELNRLPPEEQERVFELQQPESGRQAFELATLGVPVDRERIHCPLLLVGATDDRITPASLVAKVAKYLGAEYREHHAQAHMIVHEPGWEEVAEDTAGWIDQAIRE